MTPRLWFSLSLRIIGMWELIEAAEHFVTMFNIKSGLYQPAYT